MVRARRAATARAASSREPRNGMPRNKSVPCSCKRGRVTSCCDGLCSPACLQPAVHLLEGAAAVEQFQQHVGFGRYAKVTPAERILQDEPNFPAYDLAGKADLRRQPQPERCNREPCGLTACIGSPAAPLPIRRDTEHARATTPKSASDPNRAAAWSRSRLPAAIPPRPWRCLPCRAATRGRAHPGVLRRGMRYGPCSTMSSA